MIIANDNPPALYSYVDQKPINAWNIPTVSLTSLASRDAVYEQLPYSVVNPNTTLYSFAQAADLVDISGKPIQDVQAYKPERMLLQEAIIATASEVQLRNDRALSYDDSIKQTVDSVLATIPAENIQAYTQEMDAFYRDTQTRMLAAARQGTSLSSDDNKAFQQAEQELMASDVKRKTPAVFAPGESRDTTLARRATQIRYSEVGRTKAGEMVQQAIAQQFDEGKLAPITLHDRADARVYMINGGQASGKGYNASELEQEMGAASDLERTDRIYVNGDGFKPLLEGPEHAGKNKYVKSQLIQNEVGLLKGRIMSRLASAEQIPNVLIDQVYPGPDTIQIGTSVRETMKIAVIAKDVDKAIDLSFKRGEESGRYEDSKSVLTAHRNVSVQLIERMIQNAGKNISIEIFDSNILEKPPVVIMQSDVKAKSINVIDPIAASRYFDKARMNIDAERKEDLYIPPLEPNLGFLKSLSEAYKDITVALPDQHGAPLATLTLENGKFVATSNDGLKAALAQNPKLKDLLNASASQSMLSDSVKDIVEQAVDTMPPGTRVGDKKNHGPLVDVSKDLRVGE